MNLKLQNKVAVITGSTRGIGLATAKILYSQGCKLIINGRSDKNVKQILDDLPGSIFVKGDVTNEKDAQIIVQAAIEHFNRIDILVCNVGSGDSVIPGDENTSEWQKMFSINFLSTTNIIEKSKNYLSVNNGVIICISSICGLEVIPSAPITYSSIKATLNAYVSGISRPFGKLGIRINAVAPGNINFEGSTWSKKIQENPKQVENMLNSEVALGRLGKPEDVGNLVAYLSSPISNFITGSVFTVDGGQHRS